MDHVMHAEPGVFKVMGVPLDDPKSRIEACEKEIAAVLEKYGCILIVQVAAKE